ncbi:hypothetical protein BT93_L0067 [Corymbia citriodora subsp. variegata]|uniref:NAC domain-containing protein n=1 Tax=Corymbia citriodora subsp. variegata TaxID=360336 RepID=A0A8T0CQU7_CORYI|nr:hypothetical protein BT93_L0067 [Corymbia citriodora subsp. variegata]
MAGRIIPANNDQNQLLAMLPPGFRFFPSDEEIFRYYLANKNDRSNPELGNHFDHNVIRELDVLGYSPLELSEQPYFVHGSGPVTRHWYFYTAARGPAERHSRVRAVNDGFWLMRGRSNNAVVAGGREVLGTKSCFVFYMGNSVQNAVATDWTMHEFALPNHAQASFVLHRLFVKPRTESSSASARNDGVLTYEAAPLGNREDLIVSEIHNHAPEGQNPAPVHLNQTIYLNSRVNHHYGESDGDENFDADFAAPPATGAPRVDYIELNDFFSPL